MSEALTLEEFVDKGGHERACVVLDVAALPPTAVENLRKLKRLGLLTGEAIFCLVGQAPLDPYGIFGALQSFGPWAFQPLDFTALSILAKKGAKPVALMRIDLLSDDLTFVALKGEALEQHDVLLGEDLIARMRVPGTKATDVTALIRGKMKAAVDAGMAEGSK